MVSSQGPVFTVFCLSVCLRVSLCGLMTLNGALLDSTMKSVDFSGFILFSEGSTEGAQGLMGFLEICLVTVVPQLLSPENLANSISEYFHL